MNNDQTRRERDKRWNELARLCARARSRDAENAALTELLAVMNGFLKARARQYVPGDVDATVTDLNYKVYECLRKWRRTKIRSFAKYVRGAITHHMYDILKRRQTQVGKAMHRAVSIDALEVGSQECLDLAVPLPVDYHDARLVALSALESPVDQLIIKLLSQGYSASDIAEHTFFVKRSTVTRRIKRMAAQVMRNKRR
jgi:DNA-directed RNA polymerase specialized sigma24 family protein